MNRNRKLSTATYGPRHVQPHNPYGAATKSRRKLMHTSETRAGNPDGRANKDM